MKLKLAVTAVTLAATPVFAQAPKSSDGPPKPTTAEIQRVAKSISADKAKMQTYCDIGKINQQMAAADQKKDTKTLQELGTKADGLMQKLGPDFTNLMDGLDEIDDNSPEGKVFMATFAELDKQCK